MQDDSPVPFLDLARGYEETAAEMEAAVLEVLRSRGYVLGPAVERFEREVAEFLGVEHALGVSSGSEALLLALVALDVGPGDQVVTTPFTFFSTVSSIVRSGAEPVFADVSEEDLLLDAEAVSAVVGDRTRAILPVHLYGQCVDFEAIDAIARPRGIPVIEDAAQAIGARRSGLGAGQFGDLSCFSFYPTKNLAACGDAGLVVTTDDRLMARVRRLRDHGSERRYEHLEIGWNARLDGIQAAALSVGLGRLEERNRARVARASRYDALIAQAELSDIVRPLRTAPAAEHVFHQYVVRVPERDRLQEHLNARGIGSAIYYPTPLHLQPCFDSLGYAVGDFPIAERAAGEVLALPMFPQLRDAEQERVISEIASFYR